MAMMDKNTVENLIILVCGVLIFNSLVSFPVVGPYLASHPYIVFGVAIVLLIFKDKIANLFGG